MEAVGHHLGEGGHVGAGAGASEGGHAEHFFLFFSKSRSEICKIYGPVCVIMHNYVPFRNATSSLRMKNCYFSEKKLTNSILYVWLKNIFSFAFG